MSDNLISKGKHLGKLNSIQFGYTEADNEQICLGFEIVGDGDEDAGRFISSFRFFSDAAVQYTVDDLKTLGWNGEPLADLPKMLADGRLGATEVELVVDHEEYQGKWSARVKYINRVGGGQVRMKKPMDEAQLARFSTSMTARLKQIAGSPRPPRSNGGSAPPSNRHPNAPGGANDDIPF